jgi:hypothetical protein
VGIFYGLGPVFFRLQKVVDTPVSIPMSSYDYPLIEFPAFLGSRRPISSYKITGCFPSSADVGSVVTTFSTNFYDTINVNIKIKTKHSYLSTGVFSYNNIWWTP